MKPILALASVLLLFLRAQSQEIASVFPLQDQLVYGPMEGSGVADSVVATPKRKLLPDNMSFMERSLWSDDGLFRNVGLASPLTPEVRKSELNLRRTMLSVHQIGGFVTLGLMASAAYCGQQVLNGNRQYLPAHKAFVTSTIISYSATGILSVMSPPPLIRRDEFSTTTVHKALAWVHFLGMVVTPIIGATIRHSSNVDMARYHQISAYVTTGALAASMITVTF